MTTGPSAGRSASPGLISRLVQGACALPLLLLALWLIWDYPVATPWLALLLLSAAALQWLRPTAWLILVPALLPVLELPPWSGRLLLDEYDALLALLAGVALLQGEYDAGGRQIMRRSYLPLWVLGLAVVVGLVRGLLPLAPLDANAWSGYLTTWNALRVGKGFLWALLLAPLVTAQLARDRARTEEDFTLGVVVGALLFGVVVLWERGFFLDLVTARNIWDLVDTWLNLSARYRITGLFSQMHFGGTAVDGFIVLIWPFALLLLLKARNPVLLVAAAAALALAAYACLVTFTRTTYLAVAVAGLIALLPLLRGAGPRELQALLALLLFALLLGAATVVGFRFGGTLLLIAVSATLAAAVALGFLAPRLPVPWAPIALALAVLAGFLLALDGILTSKYRESGLLTALLVAVPLVAGAAGGGWGLGWLGRRFPPRIVLVVGFSLVLLLPVVALGLGGTQMKVRMASVSDDFDGRLSHWRSAIDVADRSLPAMLLGQGLGRFPAAYLAGPRGAREGTYAWGDGTLRLTGSEALRVGQRLVGWKPGLVQVDVRYRVLAGSPSLLLQLARRPLLVQEWFGAQVNGRVKLRRNADDWQMATLKLDGRKLSPPRWYQPSYTLFSLHVGGTDTSVVEIDAIRVRNGAGRDLLANADFAAGGDRWLAFNDYDHLAWHAKSLPLIIWLDLGLLGLIAVVLFLVPAFARLSRRAARGERFPLALLAALSGFLVLGLTATLFDVPRLTMLFWLMATMALYRRRQRPGGQPGRRRQRFRDDRQPTAAGAVPTTDRTTNDFRSRRWSG